MRRFPVRPVIGARASCACARVELLASILAETTGGERREFPSELRFPFPVWLDFLCRRRPSTSGACALFDELAAVDLVFDAKRFSFGTEFPMFLRDDAGCLRKALGRQRV